MIEINGRGSIDVMKQYAAMLAAAALLCSAGLASAQSRNYDSSGAPKSSGSSQRSGGGLVDNATTGAGKATDMTADDPRKPDWRAGDSDGAQVAPPVDSTGTLKSKEENKAR
jgi:hypothetical protein